MCSARDNAALPALGFPIRKSTGQRLFSASPRLIAAVHALHRLLGAKASTVCPYYLDGDHSSTEPIRHPRSVIPVRTLACCAVFKVRARRARARAGTSFEPPATAGLSKLNSMRAVSRHDARFSRHVRHARSAVDMIARRRQAIAATRGRRSAERLPRKEVIQPHLPVRLPCYDFTPVTSPTFDGSLPCGLGHRLRVLLTPVV